VHETSEISDENQQATSLETTENDEKPQENIGINASRNQAYNINDVKEVENPQSTISNEPPENPTDISQDQNTWRDTPPPDGRVYWAPEPPCVHSHIHTKELDQITSRTHRIKLELACAMLYPKLSFQLFTS